MDEKMGTRHGCAARVLPGPMKALSARSRFLGGSDERCFIDIADYTGITTTDFS